MDGKENREEIVEEIGCFWLEPNMWKLEGDPSIVVRKKSHVYSPADEGSSYNDVIS
jgi:hypothetical protein